MPRCRVLLGALHVRLYPGFITQYLEQTQEKKTNFRGKVRRRVESSSHPHWRQIPGSGAEPWDIDETRLSSVMSAPPKSLPPAEFAGATHSRRQQPRSVPREASGPQRTALPARARAPQPTPGQMGGGAYLRLKRAGPGIVLLACLVLALGALPGDATSHQTCADPKLCFLGTDGCGLLWSHCFATSSGNLNGGSWA